MVCIFMDGFDKYGPANNTNNVTTAGLMAGEWATAGTTFNIVAGLSSVGQALFIGSGSTNINRVFGTNVARIIGGLRFALNTGGSGNMLISFLDGITAQVSILNTATGALQVRNGGATGTILGTSSATVTAGTIHYLEWDITISATGSYQLWVDGVSVLSGSGDTNVTANNFVTGVSVGTPGSSTGYTIDDMYLFDTTGTINNAVLLTSPRVETTFPASDSSVQFSIGASVIGSPVLRNSAGSTTGLTANQIYLRPVTCSRAMTLNTIFFLPTSSQGTASIKLLLYADGSGLPGALLGQSATVTGITANVALVGNLLSPVVLTAGTQYWIGLMTDTALGTHTMQDALTLGRSAANTFSGGAPSTAPVMGAAPTYAFWGSVTLVAPVNFYEVSQQPAAGIYSYVYDSVIGHEDLYNFAALSVIPTAIYAVSVKSWSAKSDTGLRTMSMRMLSAGVDSGGSNVGIGLGTSFQWYDTMFDNDPGTGSPWTGVGLNAAQSGFRIDA
jgi:hypothetical protein